MSKIRVYELAKELTTGTQKVTSKELVAKAAELGIPVENHLSQLDETEAVRLKKAIKTAQDSESGQVKRVRRSVVRRRRGSDSPAGAAEAAEGAAEETTETPTTVRRRRVVDEDAPAPAPEESAPEEAPAEPAEEVEVEPVATAPESLGEESPAPAAQEEDAAADEPTLAAEETPEPEAAPEASTADETEPAEAEVEVGDAPEEKTAGSEDETATVEAATVGAATVEAATDGNAQEPPASAATKAPDAPRLVPTRRKKKDGFTAVVVAMPEPKEEAPAPTLPQRPSVSRRQLDKEDRADRPRRKGKKLIYDRRRQPGGKAFGAARTGKTRRKKKAKRNEHEMPQTSALPKKIHIPDTITVSDLAQKMAIKSNLLLRKLVEQGVMATVNDALDYETAAIIATDLGYEVENVSFDITQYLHVQDDKPEELEPRPPVVTIMGHVDHGKTSLLDRIQTSDIAGGEAGGITQSIGAYVVQVEKGKVVFVDTPGHEAFTAMRARGAMVTDLVILVVAADDGVMPQTIESINHAKAAKVPIVVAVNKVDKPEADVQRVRRELAEHELMCEEWGGSTIFCDLSAKTGDGVPQLLEMLVLQSEVLELTANPNKRAKGIIIESRLEKGRGPVASVVVQEGTLKVGDVVIAGASSGRIRALIDEHGKQVDAIGPSFPAELIGLDRVPPAGEILYVVRDEKSAKLVTDHLDKKEREERLAKAKKPTFEQLFSQMGEDGAKVLKVVLKADTQGSADAIRQGMEALSTDAVELEVIHEGVGVISENDVNLAMASDGLVLGFNVRPDNIAQSVADAQNVRILTFNLIHELIDKTRALMEGKLDLIEEEVYLGKAEIRQVFSISRVGKIAGCYVLDGKVLRNALVRVKREEKVIHTGKLSSLKRFKEDAREVQQGFECGMSVDNFNDIREGDIIEAFEIQKVAATL